VGRAELGEEDAGGGRAGELALVRSEKLQSTAAAAAAAAATAARCN